MNGPRHARDRGSPAAPSRWRALAFLLALAVAPGLARAQGTACDGKAFAIARIQCLIDAAEAAGDPAVCTRSAEARVRFHCLSLYAEHSGDPAPCGLIESAQEQGEALRGACIAGVALAHDAPEICRQAGSVPLRDSCYLMLVVQKGLDPTLCDRIATPQLRKTCRETPPAK